MRLKEIKRRIQKKLGISQDVADHFYVQMFLCIREALAAGENVEVPHLGRFYSRLRLPDDGKKDPVLHPEIQVVFRQFSDCARALFEDSPYKEEVIMSESKPRRAVLTEDRPSTGINPTPTSVPIEERQKSGHSGPERVIQENSNAAGKPKD